MYGITVNLVRVISAESLPMIDGRAQFLFINDRDH